MEPKVRKLSNRKRRASKGRVIRVSDALFLALNKNRGTRSWHALLRLIFGLPNRRGEVRPLVEGLLEVTTGKFYLKTPEKAWRAVEEAAYETAIIAAARARTKKVNNPIRLRELP